MSDAEILALLAEEAEFAKGELSRALEADGGGAGALSPMPLILDGLRESAEALDLRPMAEMMTWVASNLQAFAAPGGGDIKRTLLIELLTGWLSSFIGLCANPGKQTLRDSFEAALERREWPRPIPDTLLAEILASVSVDSELSPHARSLRQPPAEASGAVAASEEAIDLRPGAKVDDDVWQGFASQGREEVAVLGELLRDPDLEIYGELARDAEELAGSVAAGARAMEIPAIADLAKALEDLLESMEEGEVEEERVNLVLRAITILDAQFQHLGAADAPKEADPAAVLYEIRALLDTETAWLGATLSSLDMEAGPDERPRREKGDEPPAADAAEAENSAVSDAYAKPSAQDGGGASLLFDPATDPRLLEAFFQETPEQAAQLVAMLRGIEHGALIGEAMRDAQRIAHTIKGACAFVGLQSVYDLSYPLEEALEGLEAGPPSPAFGELLIEVADVIERLFDGIAAHDPAAPIDITPYVEKLWEWAKQLNPQQEEEDEEAQQPDGLGDDGSADEESTSLRMGGEVDPRLIEAFFAETPGIVQPLVEFLRRGEGLSGGDMMEAQRLAHTLKGSCGFVGLDEVYDLAYPLEEALEGLGADSPPAGFADLLIEVADILELLFELLLSGEKSAPIDCAPFVEQLWQWAHHINPQEALDQGTIDTSSSLPGEEESDSALITLNELADDREEPVMADEAELGGLDVDTSLGGDSEAGEPFDPMGMEEPSLFDDLPSFDLEAMESGGVGTRLAEDLDPRLAEAFYLETPDQVAELGELLRSAQRGELAGERVTEAQRVAHTVKGACALVGLGEVRDLAHHLEDVLELLGEEAPPAELADLLAETGDTLESVFDAIQAGEEQVSVDVDGLLAGFSDWAQRLGAASGTLPDGGVVDPSASAAGGVTDITLAADLDPRLAEAFFVETPDQVAELAVLLRAAGEGGLLGELVTEAQRLAHTVKGACALVGLAQVQIFAHRLEDVLERLGERPPPDALAGLLVEVADTLEGIFDGVTARYDQIPTSLDPLLAQLDLWAARLSGENEDDEERIEEDALEEEGDLSPEELLWDENVDPKMLDEFFIEAPDNAAALCRLIYEKRIQQEESRTEAARRAAAVEHWSRTVGIHPLRRIGQYLKVVLQAPRDEPFSPAAMGMLEENAELLDNLLGAIQGKNDPIHDAGERIRDLAQWAKRVGESLKEASAAGVKGGAAAARAEAAPAQVAESSLRVPTSRIIDLMRLVGEMTTAVSQLQGRLAPVLEYVTAIHRQGLVTSQRLADLETLVEVRSKPADEHGEDFDPLEMDQYHELHGIASALNEAFVDSQEIAKLAEDQLQDLAMIAHRQERLSRDVNEAVLATRMIPVSVLVPRLERTVREACRAAGKKARIHVEGEHLLADTDIIGGLRDALMHMLRNSVDHGIEMPAKRLQKLKPEEGRIDIGFRRQGNTILIRVLDDGAGFDVERIRQTAAKRGLELQQDLPDNEVLRLVLMPGFSTKQNVTTLSGRGIGMDVVRQSVEDLGGTVMLNNRPEGGAETTIRLPLTLVSAPVLLVRYAGQRFAIPSDDVNQILYPDQGSIYAAEGGWRFRLGSEDFRIRSFASLIGRGSDEREFQDYIGKTVLLIQQDTSPLALLLDKAEESRDVVVRQLGPWLQSVKGVAGACILANGDVAPIIDMRAMLRDERERSLADDLDRDFFENYYDDDTAERVPVVMVVDDSLSARKSLEIAVEAAGYQAVPAIDGLDAIRLMDEQLPDLLLVDMEMPKMNGLELTTHARAQPETANIPVVMITSRSTKKHRDRALAAGVTHYLTKPFDQQQLHGIMAALLQRGGNSSRGEAR